MFTRLFENSELFFKNLNRFISRNNNLAELLFLILHSLEQVFLVYFTLKAQKNLEYIISIFIIIFLFTFALQKICLELRTKYLEEILNNTILEKNLIINETQNIYKTNEEMNEIIEELSKDLNKITPNKIKEVKP